MHLKPPRSCIAESIRISSPGKVQESRWKWWSMPTVQCVSMHCQESQSLILLRSPCSLHHVDQNVTCTSKQPYDAWGIEQVHTYYCKIIYENSDSTLEDRKINISWFLGGILNLHIFLQDYARSFRFQVSARCTILHLAMPSCVFRSLRKPHFLLHKA